MVRELANIIGGQTEIKTPVGRIDLINDYLILEAKKAKEFKWAIGQLYSYCLYYERPYRALGMIGPLHKYCSEVCEKLDILLFHYNLNNYQWELIG